MKTIKTALLLLIAFTITNCGQKQEPKEKYCGIEISGFEVIDLKAIGDKGFNYTEEDRSTERGLTAELNALFDNTKNIKVIFFMKTDDTIGMYIMAPDDQQVVEKISCHILTNTFNGRLPENRKLLFYTDAHDTLVAAIKTKPRKKQ
jgi:hypothetical protein